MDHYDLRSTSQVLYTVLDRCVEDVLTLIKPLESDRNLRLNAIAEIVNSVQSIGTLKGAAVKPFGSFVSNLYSKWGDLDISITLDQHFNSCASRKKKQSVLREIMKTLRKRGIGRKFQFIPQARVPLLVYESSLYGISCDVSVDNHQGRVKSKILQHITSFDERFADMVLLIKEWAKTHSINNPKTGTLNSYSLCLLVIFHLQTCKPAILPPLKEIYDGNICDDVEGVDTEREREIDDICGLNVQKIISHISRHRNESSLADLLVSFFDKFSEIEALSSEYVICTFTGRWERMASNTRWTEKSYCLYIEDPFEQPDNAARAVGSHNLSTIAGVVHMTHQLLFSSSVLSDRKSLLHLLCRPLVSSLLGAPIYTHRQANMHQYPNMTGNQQSPEHVGYCVSTFAESSLNQDRTTKIRSTGKVSADPNQSTHLANGNQQSPDCVGYCVSAVAESSLNQDRTTKIRTTRKVYAGQSTHLDNGSNSSQRSKRNEKSVYYGSSFRVAEDQVHEPSLNHNYRIGCSDLNHLSQPANDTSQSNLREESAEYVPSIQIAKYSQDSKLTYNHRNRQAHYSAQRMDRTSQDHVVNLNESRRIRSEIVEPKHDNMTRNYRNNQMRFAGRTPGRFDQHHNSGSNGGHRTGMTNGEPSIGPSMIRSHQSHPLVRYSTTPTGSIDQDIDASIDRSRIHRPGLAIVEPVPEQLNHSLNLNGSSFGYRSNKGKQIWQPKFASNQVFQ